MPVFSSSAASRLTHFRCDLRVRRNNVLYRPTAGGFGFPMKAARGSQRRTTCIGDGENGVESIMNTKGTNPEIREHLTRKRDI